MAKSAKGIHTPEFERKLRKKRMIKLSIISAVVLVLVVLPIYLSRISRFHIANITISGNTVTSDADIDEIVQKDLSGNYLWIFPHRNAVIFPKNKIKADILNAIPRLSSANITLADSRSININVTERKPEALYCEDITNILMPEHCFFLDDKGFIFSPAPSFSGDVYFIYTLPVTLEDPLGKQLVPEEEFSLLPEYISSLESMGIYGRAMIIEDEDYHLLLPNRGEVIWKRSDQLELIRENLSDFLDNVTKTDKHFLDNILYIDLRFENKVFYKFQNER